LELGRTGTATVVVMRGDVAGTTNYGFLGLYSREFGAC